MDSYYKLSFITDEDKKVSINVPNANTDVPAAIVTAIMEDLILSTAIQTSYGDLKSISKAELYTTTIKDIIVK